MRKIIMILLLYSFIVTSLTACLGGYELDDWAYVYSIGIDKGVSDQLQFSFQIPTIKGGGSSGGGQGASGTQGKSATSVLSIDCGTFYSGVNMINSSLSRSLNFSHTKYYIISEDLAREGVSRFVNGMIRNGQIRRIMHVIIVRGSAREFLKEFNPILGTSVSRTQELMMQKADNTGLFDDVNYNQFAFGMKNSSIESTAALAAINDFSSFKTSGSQSKSFKSGGDYYAGELPRSGGNKFEFVGTALFDGDKMIGELNGDETRAMLMTRGEFKGGSIIIPDPKDHELRISADTHQKKNPSIKVSFQNGKPVINVRVFLEADLENIQSSTEYENEKLKPVLENAFKTFIKDTLDKTIDKCKGLNCDVFSFGETAAMHFLTIPEWEAYNWISHFKDAEVTTEVEYIIRRTGTLMKTSPVINTEGKKE